MSVSGMGASARLCSCKRRALWVVSAFSRRRLPARHCRYWRCRPARSGRICGSAGAASRQLYAEGQPAATTSVDIASGAARNFDSGRDIPGEWWKVFHSKELDNLIAEALQANPSLQAAQAALWQAKETLYASEGKLMPTMRRQRVSRASAILAVRIRRRRRAVHFQSVPVDGERLYRPTCSAASAADRDAGGAGRLSALPARGDVSDLDLERGDGGGAGGVAARPDRRRRATSSNRRSTSSTSSTINSTPAPGRRQTY